MKKNLEIRAVQFIDSYYPMVDGVTQTVDHYAQLMGSGVVCPKMPQGYDAERFPYEVITSAAFRIPNTQYACATPWLDARLRRQVIGQNADLFHAHTPAPVGRYALAMGRKLKIPVVATFHSKYYDVLLEFTKSRALSRLATNGIVRFYEQCDSVWSCSEGTAETLRSYGYKGEIVVMTNGTGFDCSGNLETQAAEAAERFGIPKDRHVLLFVGQMVWYKNQRLLLDAFRLLCDESEDYCLVLAGSGRDDNEIRGYARSLCFRDDQVIFTGRILEPEWMKGLYGCSNLLFFPSVFDNTPLVVREAASAGLPALLIAGSNAAENIRDGENGFLAAENPAAMRDAIRSIFADPSRLASVGQTARETIPVGWEKLIVRVEEEYRKILERYRRTS